MCKRIDRCGIRSSLLVAEPNKPDIACQRVKACQSIVLDIGVFESIGVGAHADWMASVGNRGACASGVGVVYSCGVIDSVTQVRTSIALIRKQLSDTHQILSNASDWHANNSNSEFDVIVFQ
jgi:hypothetical protein